MPNRQFEDQALVPAPRTSARALRANSAEHWAY